MKDFHFSPTVSTEMQELCSCISILKRDLGDSGSEDLLAQATMKMIDYMQETLQSLVKKVYADSYTKEAVYAAFINGFISDGGQPEDCDIWLDNRRSAIFKDFT